MGIQVRGLDEVLSRLNEAQTDELCTEIVKGVTARLIDGAKKLTPFKTGHLRNGFTAGREVDGSTYMLTETVTKQGRVFKYTLINSVEYAPYVEYGHRQTPGRYVPAIGKRLKRSEVEGRHMLLKAEQQVDAELDNYVAKKVEKKLKEIFD